ncbi:hypothetical protein SGLAM104S_01315 [Streptomyces glaucescens]
MTIPIWTTARLGGLLPGLGDLLEHAHLAEAEVGGELVHVLLEAAPQVVGGEVPQHVVGADELGHALPFGRQAVPSAAATSAHIAMQASRNAPLVSSFFFAVSWACTCDAVLEAVPQGHGISFGAIRASTVMSTVM